MFYILYFIFVGIIWISLLIFEGWKMKWMMIVDMVGGGGLRIDGGVVF